MTAAVSYPRERVGGVESVNAGGRPAPAWNRQGPPPPGYVWTIEARTAARPWTEDEVYPGGRTIRVKRCCNGCGATLGDTMHRDATRGGHLADVRGECPVCTPQPGKALVGPVRYVPGVAQGLTRADAVALMRAVAAYVFWPAEPSPLEDAAYSLGYESGQHEALAAARDAWKNAMTTMDAALSDGEAGL
jgi:hypothetical protein